MFEPTDYILAGAAVPFITYALVSLAVSYLAYYVAAQFASSPGMKMPRLSNYPVQTAMKGGAIPKVYGRKRVAGNIIWCGPPIAYEVRHETGGEGGKGGGGGSSYAIETKYKRSFLIGICEGPAAFINIWKGKEQLATLNPSQETVEHFDFGTISGYKTWTSEPLTLFQGIDNAGIKALTGEDYGDYPDLCCIFFEDYDLGGTQAIPNFSFEVESGTGLENKILIYDLAGLQAMNDNLSGNYVLMTDLDATDTVNWNGGDGWMPIGTGNANSFLGTFDGRHHTIDGLYCNRTLYASLFGYVGRTGPDVAGHVRNIRLTNCDMNGQSHGMMVGTALESSTFTDCYVQGTIVITATHAVGGFAGSVSNDCIFTRCGAVGSISPWESGNYTGGFVGNSASGRGCTFVDCYARVAIAMDGGNCKHGIQTGCFDGNANDADVFTRCYAAASIQYQNSCYTYYYDTRPQSFTGGGFFGQYDTGAQTLSSCYWDTEEAASVYPDAAKFESGYKNERQGHTLDVDPTAGHYHIIHDGQTTGEIAWDANEATVQAAIDATFGAGEITFKLATTWKSGGAHLKNMFYGSSYGYSPQPDLTFDVTAIIPAVVAATYDDVTGVAPLSDANITGKTTAQMKTQSTFDGWDFDNVWYMGDSGYPELRNQALDGCDLNPAVIIKDIIEHKRYGAGRTDIVDTTSFDECEDYWDAENMRISIVLDEAKPWQDWVDYILSHVGGYRFNSGGKLHLGALKDESAAFTLTDDDLLQPNPESKILPPKINIAKRPQSDTFNRIEVNWTDRDNKYDNAVAIAYDVVDKARSGTVRKQSVKLSGIHNGDLAKRMAYRFLIDALYRFSIYKFGVSFKDMLIENGDVGNISDNDLIDTQKIRVMKVEEDRDGRGLAITAMDDFAEHYPDISYTNQESLYNPDPTITLADMTINFHEDIETDRIYLSCTPGNASFTAGYVYRSYDDASYDLIGRFGVDGVTGGDSNSAGTTDGFLPAHPAVTWAQDESILVDIGTVTGLRTDVTDDEFWNNRYLAKIDNEIIAFKTAEETATAGVWRISNLRRGLLGTEPVAHYTGESFCTLVKDYTYKFETVDIGRTLYFKVIASYGDKYQSIADVSSFSVTVQGYFARPASAALLRLTSDLNDGGSGDYSGASFTLYWNLSSRSSGVGIGGHDVNPNHPSWFYPDSEALLVTGGGALFGNYIQDPDLQAIVLKFEQEDGTAIGEREIAVGESTTITKATDLGGHSPARIKVIPRRALYAWDENSILVNDGS